MDETQTMRASDRDRQEVVDLLRGAVEDGRVTMDEYMQRMALAYQAVTYGDLAPLQADLPATGSVHGLEPAARRPAGGPAGAGVSAGGSTSGSGAAPASWPSWPDCPGCSRCCGRRG